MHVHCLHWLMSTGLLSLNAFSQPCKSTTSEMAPMEGSKFGSGDLIWLPLSVHICLGLVVEYRPFVGTCTRHSYLKLYYLCLLASLFNLLPPPTSSLASPTHPLVYAGLILMNSMKKSSKTGKNQPLSACQVSCTEANRQLSIVLSEQVQYQGRLAF